MTKIKRTLTEAGIVIETRNRTSDRDPIIIHRTTAFGGIGVSCMRHERDNTVTLNIKRTSGEGQAYMDFGLHLTPDQAIALSQLIKGCAEGV